VPPSIAGDDPFTRLAQNLGELEVVIGERARPAIAQVRAGLNDAIACRERGDIPAALTAIGSAMERLAALAGDLDPQEGAMMRMIAERFAEAMKRDLKGEVKTTVSVMRQKAGDTKEDDRNDW
jgi:hypothetical protein